MSVACKIVLKYIEHGIKAYDVVRFFTNPFRLVSLPLFLSFISLLLNLQKKDSEKKTKFDLNFVYPSIGLRCF